MIKHYCDGCGKEIERNYTSNRLRKSLHLGIHLFVIEVIVSQDQVSNKGDICVDCLMKVILDGDNLS
jgi:hypothetical protein